MSASCSAVALPLLAALTGGSESFPIGEREWGGGFYYYGSALPDGLPLGPGTGLCQIQRSDGYEDQSEEVHEPVPDVVLQKGLRHGGGGFLDPCAGGRGNSVRYMSVGLREDTMLAEGFENLFLGGEKSIWFCFSSICA